MDLFFDFLKYSMNIRDYESSYFSNVNWYKLFEFGNKQSLLGILFLGIEKLKQSNSKINIPHNLLMQWIMYSEKIHYRNELLNKNICKLFHKFEEDGFYSCLLKGQGNAYLYPDPLKRIPGDIDVWLIPNDKEKLSLRKRRKIINKYVKENFSCCKINTQHISFETKHHIDIEVHCTPMIVNNYLYNYRIQKWFMANLNDTITNEQLKCKIPSWKFNVVYQLIHIFRHFFDEGVGLRQLMDYYYLLMQCPEKYDDIEFQNTLYNLGILNFTQGIMWILGYVFDMPMDRNLVERNENKGKLILSEVLNGGNFGKYDFKYGGLTKKNIINKYFTKVYRSLCLAKEFPSEALCEPIYRTWHFFWKILHNK